MSQEVIASLITGAVSLLAVVLSAYANWRVEGLSKELEPQRASAYRRLWSLTAPLTPTDKAALPAGTREALEQSLKAWYYDDGNGVFLSAESQRRFLAARKLLRHEVEPSTDDAVRLAFSDLRSQLKDDLKVYRGRDRWKRLG